MSDGPTKAALRTAAIARRDALSPADRAIAAAFIARHAEPVLSAAVPRTVGAYRAFASEADPGPILAACEADGISVALATMIDTTTMHFYPYRAGDPLVRDAMGIPAPPGSALLVDPDLILVPVTAFDRRGVRLGKGRGIFDRAVSHFRSRGIDPLLVGIAFSVQEVPSIPAEPHDVRLDWIVTETGARDFRALAGSKSNEIS